MIPLLLQLLNASKIVQNVLKVFFQVSILESVDTRQPLKEKVLDAASFVRCVSILPSGGHSCSDCITPGCAKALLGLPRIRRDRWLAGWLAGLRVSLHVWPGRRGRVEHLLAPREGLMNQ